MPQRRGGADGSNRGFASMDQNKQREIASKGGQSVPNEKRSFSKNRALAAEAGRKGGQSVGAEDRSFSQDRELAAQAGRKGGEARGGARKGRKAQPHEEQPQEPETKVDQPDDDVDHPDDEGESGPSRWH